MIRLAVLAILVLASPAFATERLADAIGGLLGETHAGAGVSVNAGAGGVSVGIGAGIAGPAAGAGAGAHVDAPGASIGVGIGAGVAAPPSVTAPQAVPQPPPSAAETERERRIRDRVGALEPGRRLQLMAWCAEVIGPPPQGSADTLWICEFVRSVLGK